MAAGILDKPLSHEEVMETGKIAADNIKKLIDGFIKRQSK
jgi:purine nucleoside phosphorylase